MVVDDSPTSDPRSRGLGAAVRVALGVRPDEVERVAGLVRSSFLLGIALVLFYSSANAIFLTRYDIGVLPWVYIANAVAVIAVGFAYGAWSARVPVARALVGLARAMTVSVGVLWLWATLSDDRIVAFLLAMWFRLLFIFAVLGLWEIASAVFDIRQAKRLFAAIALGMMVAFVVVGAATPVLGPLLGTVNLVGVAALVFALYTLDFRRLLHHHRVGTSMPVGAVAPAGPREIVADRYSRTMMWMKTVTILLMYLAEYAFYEQAADTFRTESSLAGFLGLYMGAMTVVMVLVTGLVSGRFISRFGIRVAILTLPAGMLATAFATGLYGQIAGIDTFFFVLVGTTLTANHVLGNAIGEPAGAVLFQPMPAVNRMRVRLAVDGWLGSVALVFSGALLLAFDALDPPSVAPYMYLIAVIALGGLWVGVVQYREYLGALRRVTTLGFAGDDRDRGSDGRDFDGRSFDPLDLGFIGDGLGAEPPGAALANAGLARSLGEHPLAVSRAGLLHSSSPDVIDLAVAAIRDDGAGRGAGGGLEVLERIVDQTALPAATRRRALAAMADVAPRRARARVRADLGDPARTPVVLALALDDHDLRPIAVERLSTLVSSSDPSDRLVAASALADSSGADDALDGMLVRLVRDADPRVVQAALAASGRWPSPALVAELVRLVAEAPHRRAAVRALAAGDPAIADALEAELASLPVDAVADVVRQVFVGDTERIVRCGLGRAAPSVVRAAAWQALAGTPEVADDLHRVGGLLADDLARVADLAAVHRSLGDTAPLTRDALVEDFELARRAVFAGLAVRYDARRLLDIETLVRTGDDDDRANAIEALDGILDPFHRREIVALLEPPGIDEVRLAAGRALADPATALASLERDPRLSAWTRRVAAHELGRPDPPDGGPAMAAPIPRVLALRRIDIFSTLSHDTLTELAELVRPHEVAAGDVIIEAGSIGRELYAIIRGAVDVTVADGTVTRLEEGTVFGELAVLDPAPRSATVTAADDVELLVVPRQAVLALVDRRPEVMTEIARVLARRLRA